MANTLSLGSGNWGAKDSLLLGYYENGKKFFPETFDVTRATGGTRVNKAGLIETPTEIVSGELVTNGDFSNGLTGWNGSDMTVSNEQLIKGGVALNYQSGVVENNKTYKVIVDVATLAGSLRVYVGGTQIVLSQGVNTLTVPSNNSNSFIGFNNGSGSVINSISAIEINQKNLARIDYLDDAKGALLTEPQSTNLVIQSANLSAGYWVPFQSSLVEGQSSPSADSPLGAYNLIESTSTGQHRLRGGTFTTVAVESTMSVYIKYSTKRFVELKNTTSGSRCKFDLLNNVVTQSIGAVGKIEDAGNGFKRISITYTSGVTSRVQLALLNDSQSGSYQGNGTDKITVFGFQIEQANAAGYDGKYATSYIPTIGQIQSRNKDQVNNGGDVNSFGSEGVLYIEGSFSDSSTGASYQMSISDGTGNNRTMIYPYSQTQVGVRLNASSVQLVNQTLTLTNINVNSKIAVAWGGGNYKLYQNGLEIYTQAIADTPTGLSKLNLGSVNGANNLLAKTKNIQVFNEALTDSELVALTTI